MNAAPMGPDDIGQNNRQFDISNARQDEIMKEIKQEMQRKEQRDSQIGQTLMMDDEPPIQDELEMFRQEYNEKNGITKRTNSPQNNVLMLRRDIEEDNQNGAELEPRKSGFKSWVNLGLGVIANFANSDTVKNLVSKVTTKELPIIAAGALTKGLSGAYSIYGVYKNNPFNMAYRRAVHTGEYLALAIYV